MNNNWDTIFIGHANPEDNYFSAWLASKLRLMGYKVWCDIKALLGGEDVWLSVTKKIRDNSIKYLFVTSSASCKKGGTLKELAIADVIRDRGEFLIPLKLDDTPVGELPAEIIRKYYIDFSNGWDIGLKKLAEKLHEDNVTKKETDQSNLLPFWYEVSEIDNDKPIDKIENYSSNWFKLQTSPKLYLHTLDLFQRIQLDRIPFPILFENNSFLTFACSECLTEYIKVRKTEEIDPIKFVLFHEYKSPEMDFSILDTNKKLVQLLNDVFSHYLISKGLKQYKLSGNRFAFYFPDDFSEMISLKKFGRKGRILVGKAKELNWHFAIEPAAFLQPLPAYFITYHVIFTKDGLPLESAASQHSQRRSLGKDWYNDKWRDMLLASMQFLSDEDNDSIELPVCKHQNIGVSNLSLNFLSDKGYLEPEKIEEPEEFIDLEGAEDNE